MTSRGVQHSLSLACSTAEVPKICGRWMAGARHRSSFKVRTILGVAILAQAICVQTPPLLARVVRSFLEGVQWPPAQKSPSWWMEEERRVGLQRPRTGCTLSKQLSKFWANMLKRRRRSPVHNSEFPRHQIPSSQLYARKFPSWRKLWRFSKVVLEERWMQSALDRGRVAAQEKSLTEQIRRTGQKTVGQVGSRKRCRKRIVGGRASTFCPPPPALTAVSDLEAEVARLRAELAATHVTPSDQPAKKPRLRGVVLKSRQQEMDAMPSFEATHWMLRDWFFHGARPDLGANEEGARGGIQWRNFSETGAFSRLDDAFKGF